MRLRDPGEGTFFRGRVWVLRAIVKHGKYLACGRYSQPSSVSGSCFQLVYVRKLRCNKKLTMRERRDRTRRSSSAYQREDGVQEHAWSAAITSRSSSSIVRELNRRRGTFVDRLVNSHAPPIVKLRCRARRRPAKWPARSPRAMQVHVQVVDPVCGPFTSRLRSVRDELFLSAGRGRDDTIRYAILTCARKQTWLRLIYRDGRLLGQWLKW